MASRTINIPATTNLDADELTSGTVPFARLSVGTGSRLAGFAVFPSYITNDQATLLATAA